MIPDPEDTIVALSSSPGPGARAVIRVTGPRAFELLGATGMATAAIDPARRALLSVALRLPGIHALLPADVYVWPQPRTFTGQDLLELHTISSPPLIEHVIAQLLNAGARAAQPGEFTMRAFLAGKLDLTQAEAVLAVIHAGSREQLKSALGQLAGGMAQPLGALRDDLLNLLADIEAGLDFAEEGIQFVDRAELAACLNRVLAELERICEQLQERAISERLFRAVLVGRPNAGKSSLFNRLVGAGAALVSAQPGTTRDYLVSTVEIGEVQVDLVDTAGWDSVFEGIEGKAQALASGQIAAADLLLLCLEAGRVPDERERSLMIRSGVPRVVPLATKCDLTPVDAEFLATSAVTGSGVEELRQRIGEEARKRVASGLAPSMSRCRHHLEACLTHLRHAQAQDAPELIALDLRSALEELGALVGAVYTDDLLDRIFSRFCIGK